MKTQQHALVVGAGLCGSLLAIRLAQRGFRVSVYEWRSDMRKTGITEGRSINLALSDRGIRALRMIGMENLVESDGIPMLGRMIHPLQGETRFMPYSGREGGATYSVSRGGLNMSLLDRAESLGADISLYFHHRCVDVDFEGRKVHFINELTSEKVEVSADVIFATDGAGSAVRRRILLGRGASPRFNFSQEFLSHGYKELHIPSGEDGGFRLEKNALHIWPRGSYMMIALPNLDGSFTVTLFQDFEGEEGLNGLDTPEKIRSFFDRNFPDAVEQMPRLVRDFEDNPSGNLGTIRCFPWSVAGNTLLLGDASHAIVPFYGQGMNCAFEDVVVLDEMMERFGEDWPAVFHAFERERKPNTDAIADLAVDNFYEMRDQTNDPVFQRKNKLETLLEHSFSDFYTKYGMVTFRADMPYSEAMRRGRAQDKVLMGICSHLQDVATADLVVVREEVEKKVQALLRFS